MKTFLPQNKFYSAVDIPSAAGSAGATPCPQPRAVAAPTCSATDAHQSQQRDVRETKRPETDLGMATELQGTAVIDSCQEPVAADLIEFLGDGNTVGRTGNAVADAVNGTETSGMDVTARRDEHINHIRADLSDCIGLLFYHARRLALPRFAPDYEAIWSAMHDPNAPRMLAGDPVWADASPLFLRDA